MLPDETRPPEFAYATVDEWGDMVPEPEYPGVLNAALLDELNPHPAVRAFIEKPWTPQTVQAFLTSCDYSTVPYGASETYQSISSVRATKRADCFEGGIGVAVPLLYLWGYEPRVVLLQADNAHDPDHNIIVYRDGDYLGSVEKAYEPEKYHKGMPLELERRFNGRDPIYRSLHGLAMSYYAYYTYEDYTRSKPTHVRCMLGYTQPIDVVGKYGTSWFVRHGSTALGDIYQTYTDGVMCRSVFGGPDYAYVNDPWTAEMHAGRIKL